MGVFQTVLQTMYEMGMNLFLPWLLILSVTYGILDKYNVLSDDPQVNGVISLSFAFISVLGVNQFAPAGMWTQFAANISFGVFGLLAMLILMAVAGYDVSDLAGDRWSLPVIFGGVIAIVSFIGILISYGDSGAIVEGNLFDEVVMPILTLIFVLLLVYFTT
jgi:hypothetical protein